MCLTPQLRELNVQKRFEPVVLLACCLGHVFAAQPRTFFRQLNFQKCSDPAVCLAFWLGNALCATAACNFWSDPARWLCTRRCSEPTFSTRAKKTQCFAAFLPVRAIWSSFLASLRPSLSLSFLSLSLSPPPLAVSQLLLQLSIGQEFDFSTSSDTCLAPQFPSPCY